VTDARDDDEPSGRQADAPTPWHHSTAKVFGASIAALAALALTVAGVMVVSREAGETPQAPLNFVDPSFSSMISTSNSSSTSTTTTRISPPLTTDLDVPPELSTPPPSSPSASETTSSRGRSSTGTEESGESSEESAPRTTTRSRPRLNETRTLYPRP
jgi:hypothetical protein